MQEENFNEDKDSQLDSDNEKESFENKSGSFQQWIQNNLRIILSVIVVIAIAGGIYSYSKRSPEQNNTSNVASQIENEEQQNQQKVDQNKEEKTNVTEEKNKEENQNNQKTEKEKNKPKSQEKVSATQTEKISQETENSFIETASKGEGLTHLARHALSDYLEKNPDSELKPEQKIYIEDYLRKHIGFNKRIYPGTSVEFSKNLIKEAINHSKQLNKAQIRNLHKYVLRVPTLQ